jgi:alkylation response protein AidB-like acyl-CoA dehydrogenase
MQQNIPPPSTLIRAEYSQLIRSHAAEAEQLGMLHPAQLALIYEQKWFKALMPVEYGGLGLALPEIVRLQEALSYADGSFGWVFTLCSGAGWFAGFIDTNLAQTLFADEKTCLAGSGAATGTAVITADGYTLNGEWNYASGAHHATHFTANCLIKNGKDIVLDDGGKPLILPFIVDKKDVELLSTWKYIGMVATGSHAFKIENLHVGKERCFKITPDFATINRQLYKYPFLQLAEATLAANISGMAVHFVDLAETVIQKRIDLDKYTIEQQKNVLAKLSIINADLNLSRRVFYANVDSSWEHTDEKHLQEVSKASRHLAKTACEQVDALFPYCGLMAAAPDTEINRAWRDLHTASQHTLLTFES